MHAAHLDSRDVAEIDLLAAEIIPVAPVDHAIEERNGAIEHHRRAL